MSIEDESFPTSLCGYLEGTLVVSPQNDFVTYFFTTMSTHEDVVNQYRILHNWNFSWNLNTGWVRFEKRTPNLKIFHSPSFVSWMNPSCFTGCLSKCPVPENFDGKPAGFGDFGWSTIQNSRRHNRMSWTHCFWSTYSSRLDPSLWTKDFRYPIRGGPFKHWFWLNHHLAKLLKLLEIFPKKYHLLPPFLLLPTSKKLDLNLEVDPNGWQGW